MKLSTWQGKARVAGSDESGNDHEPMSLEWALIGDVLLAHGLGSKLKFGAGKSYKGC
jgi:hypothetical protein